MRHKWNLFKMPKDMTGKTFLELGCWDGSLCIEALARGAERAVGVDTCVCPVLKENVEEFGFEFYQIDILSERFLSLGVFDIVAFNGVLYHLAEPLAALQRVRNVTRELLVCETRVTNLNPGRAVMEFTFSEKSNWWSPNKLCLNKMMESVGFKTPKEVYTLKQGSFSRVGVHAIPDKRNVSKGAPRTNAPGPEYENRNPNM
jgi:tRNA (mo5U34)-methyltransferase